MSDNKILVGDMSRKQCLEILKRLLEAMETFDGISPSPERINALKMAIASLETDEAYQLEYESTTKNDLGVDAISRQAVLDLINADWKYENFEIEINNLPSVTPQEPRKGYLSIDDVMSVFDDFMCGEVDEDGTETFLEMLKDKAESEE